MVPATPVYKQGQLFAFYRGACHLPSPDTHRGLSKSLSLEAQHAQRQATPPGPLGGGKGVLPGTWFGVCGAGDGMTVVRWFSYVPSRRTETFDFHAWGAGWSFLLELNQRKEKRLAGPTRNESNDEIQPEFKLIPQKPSHRVGQRGCPLGPWPVSRAAVPAPSHPDPSTPSLAQGLDHPGQSSGSRQETSSCLFLASDA